MSLSAGTSVGGFQIVSALGSGGMGEVYLALEVKLDREVALKVLTHAKAEGPEYVRRFEAEARLACVLNPPNIVTI